MRWSENGIELWATDLSAATSCSHKTSLDLAQVLAKAPRAVNRDPWAQLLRERGAEHEKAYIQRLTSLGRSHRSLQGPVITQEQRNARMAETISAMRDGVEVIVQGVLGHARWFGQPDVLVRVPGKTALGEYGYEVHDTKLASETSAATLMQLALYSDLTSKILGIMPQWFHVVTPLVAERFRPADVLAFYRHVARRVTSAVEDLAPAPSTYPEPVPHCEVCDWWLGCEDQRRKDDHPSYVAGLSRLHRRALAAHQVTTLAGVAALSDPMSIKFSRGARETYGRLREQARLQVKARDSGQVCFDVLRPEKDRGFGMLPEPSPGDVFLDLEGDPFIREGGREYLFGVSTGDAAAPGLHQRWWATSDSEERAAFLAALDFIMQKWADDPGMHVYHFGAYEPAAFKRLMGRYAVGEETVDRLLRGRRFVNLHRVVKQSLQAGVEQYSLKDLERYHGFVRLVPLETASAARRRVALALARGLYDLVDDGVRKNVETYNDDDCRSARSLRDWLEGLRAAAIARGDHIARPVSSDGAPSEEVGKKVEGSEERRCALQAQLPDDRSMHTTEQAARWLLGHLLDWHRREDKVAFWEKYRRLELDDDEAIDERKALGGLTFISRDQDKRSSVDTFSFPEQEADIQADDKLEVADEQERPVSLGTVHDIEHGERRISIRRSARQLNRQVSRVSVNDFVSTDTMAGALLRLADDVLKDGFDRPGPALDLLLRRPPRLTGGEALTRPEEAPSASARRIVNALDRTVLAIQGPPGAGKTWTGIRMALDAIAAGKRVGLVANSHRVMGNFISEMLGVEPRTRIVHRGKATESDPVGYREVKTNEEVIKALADGEVDLLAGTCWLWSREEMKGTVDILFVDEAGQMSLANVLASAAAAQSLVLLGDPRQLDQPTRASHPDDTDRSALDHIIGTGRQVIDAEQGLFLDQTRRLPPSIARFTSELFYEGRLEPLPGAENQVLRNAGVLDGNGFFYVPAHHDACTSSSDEEVVLVRRLVASIIARGAEWTDARGVVKPLNPAEDILVIAPYNAQVGRLAAALTEHGVQVGTVDKFQGREAPLVIYSLASSSPEDAPRGMEFLYSPNRINVATSRAKCVCVLVASPKLFEPECHTARHVVLANALCRYLELAKTIEVPP